MNPTSILSLDPKLRAARIEEIKRIIASPSGAPVWEAIHQAAIKEKDLPPYLVDSIFPGRDEYAAEILGMDYTLCHSIGLRITRHAMMFLIEGDRSWIDAALRQTEVLFDDVEYPAWNHVARMKMDEEASQKTVDLKKDDVHLRTGALAYSISLMFNWLRPHLDPDQLETLVRGLEKRAIRPFQAAIKQNPWWIEVNNNWLTCIVGGLGICGMALDGLHDDARSLIEFADPLMERHLEDYGRQGEFNEAVGYAGAIYLIVNYHAARLGWSEGKDNRLAKAPYPEMATWYIQMSTPPGVLVCYGDAHAGTPLKADWMPALASALQDPYLQGYGQQHSSIIPDPLQILYLDPDLPAKDLTGYLPLGIAYHDHGACISSRTSWDWDQTPSFVGSKARREDNHEHNDAGQVVIDGEAQPLIVDWGIPDTGYPMNFFNTGRFKYFEGNAFGHNVLVFGGREMESCYELHPKYTQGPSFHGKRALHAQGKIVSSEFDDSWGGLWSIDTAPAWSGVKQNLRTVLHVHPGFVVVLDEVKLEKSESISLRWNTSTKATLIGEEGFAVQHDTVGLAARAINLTGVSTTHQLGQHRYYEPWNKDEFGGTLPERDCPYYELLTENDQCRLLSLFCIQPGVQTTPWTQVGDTHTATIGEARLDVVVNDSGLTITSSAHHKTWTIAQAL